MRRNRREDGSNPGDRDLGWARIVSEPDRVYVHCLRGDFVDAGQVQSLHEELTSLITTRIRRLDLDLRRVQSADTKLAAGLVLAARLARKCGVLLVIEPSPHVDGLLRMLKLDDLITGDR